MPFALVRRRMGHQPATTAQAISLIPDGESVWLRTLGPEETIDWRTSNWYEVTAGSQKGWCFGAYLSFLSDFSADSDSMDILVHAPLRYNFRLVKSNPPDDLGSSNNLGAPLSDKPVCTTLAAGADCRLLSLERSGADIVAVVLADDPPALRADCVTLEETVSQNTQAD